jgi:hypothetical protein
LRRNIGVQGHGLLSEILNVTGIGLIVDIFRSFLINVLREKLINIKHLRLKFVEGSITGAIAFEFCLKHGFDGGGNTGDRVIILVDEVTILENIRILELIVHRPDRAGNESHKQK